MAPADANVAGANPDDAFDANLAGTVDDAGLEDAREGTDAQADGQEPCRPRVLGTLRSYAPWSDGISIVALPSKDRAVFLDFLSLSLVKIDGQRLRVLDAQKTPLRPLADNPAPTIWVKRPLAFIVPLTEQRIAVIGKTDTLQGIDIYDLGQDRLTLVDRSGAGSMNPINAAAGRGQRLFLGRGSSLEAIQVDDSGHMSSLGQKILTDTCQGLSLSAAGQTLFAACLDGLHVLDAGSDGGLSERTVALPGKVVMDVVAGKNALAVFVLTSGTGTGDVHILRADTFDQIAVFPYQSSSGIPSGYGFFGDTLLLERAEAMGSAESLEVYALADSGAQLRGRWPICTACSESRTPAPILVNGEHVVMGGLSQVFAMDPVSAAPTLVTGPGQGGLGRVLALGPSTVLAYGPGSLQLVDVTHPESPSFLEGGKLLPNASKLGLALSDSGSPAPAFLNVEAALQGTAITLYWRKGSHLPVAAGSLASDDAQGHWGAAGDFLYQLGSETAGFHLRRFSARSISKAENQHLVPDVDQTLPRQAPEGPEAFHSFTYQVDASSGDLVLVEVQGSSVVLAWYRLGERGYELRYAKTMSADLGGPVSGFTLAKDRCVLVMSNGIVVVDRTGEIVATRRLNSSGMGILGIFGDLVTLSSTNSARVVRLDDLSDVTEYALAGVPVSVTTVGSNLVFGMDGALSVVSPACRPPQSDAGVPVCQPNRVRCSDAHTRQLCSREGSAEDAEQRAGSLCVGEGEWVACASVGACEATANPCLAVRCASDAGCSVKAKAAGVSCGGNGRCDDSGHCLGPAGPSCTGEQAGACQGKSCCRSILVPGGTFPMGMGRPGASDACPPDLVCLSGPNYDEHQATVASFYLDETEVTVGRFRQFVRAYDGTPPVAGAGAHPLLADSGWQSVWNGVLPTSAEALNRALQPSPTCQNWSSQPADRENAPMSCVSWPLAFAFCAWDGGRLPTEAEWEYAAAGGNENRLYPWGAGPPESTLVHFARNGAASNPVGSTPAGKARWGHLDLAGGMAEWVLDSYDPGSTWYAQPCVNCASLGVDLDYRVLRGGSWVSPVMALRAANRAPATAGSLSNTNGFRCARDLND